MSVSISIRSKIPIELQLHFTNPLVQNIVISTIPVYIVLFIQILKNETIHYIKNESSLYTTYSNNSFFIAKRGPLMSAHMKYIPIYQQIADGIELVTTVDFCVLNSEAVSANDILSVSKLY